MNIYDFKVLKRNGETLDLKQLEGKTLLIVNTATGCGFTPQYEGIENLYKKYKERGLEVLDFPCDQFGHQAPGSDDEIHQFCTAKYKTTFDQLKKIEVNGENEEPIYKYLKEQIPEEEIKGLKNKMAMKAIEKISTTTKNKEDIKWNFTKFLVNKNGDVVARFAPTSGADEIEEKLIEII